MNILVMAAGAVGGYYGSLLARADNDVLFVARGENLEAIRRDGLRVESVTSGRFTVRGNAAERPDGNWRADFVLFCVKSYQNAQAIETIRPAIGEGTTILTLQNGIGSGAELSDAFGRDKVMVGAAYVDAGRPEPGVFEEQGGGLPGRVRRAGRAAVGAGVGDTADAASGGDRFGDSRRHQRDAVEQARIYMRAERDDLRNALVVQRGDGDAPDGGGGAAGDGRGPPPWGRRRG